MHHEPTETPRDRRHRANLERIVEAASDVVFREGLDALSVKRVAELSDYTPGALYRYFPSKDALLTAVVVRVLEDLGARLRNDTASAASPLGGVVLAARAYRDFARESPHAFALVASMLGDPQVAVHDEASARQILAGVVVVAAPVAAMLGEAADDGELTAGDARARTLALFASLQGSIQLHKYEVRFPEVIRPNAAFDTVLEALLRGFGASDAKLRAVLSPDGSVAKKRGSRC